MKASDMTACVTPPSTGSLFNGNVSATFHFMQGKFQGYKCHTFKYLCHDVPYRKQKRLCVVVFCMFKCLLPSILTHNSPQREFYSHPKLINNHNPYKTSHLIRAEVKMIRPF